jgi:heterodisulfide reductase subunit A
VKEKIPEAEVYEYYIDMRAYGKGYEQFYERIKDEGVHLLRGKPAEIKQVGKELIVRSEDIDNETLLEQKVDMVILSVGLEPSDGSEEIARMSGISTDEEGWIEEANSLVSSVNTNVEGIMMAGLCQGPKDIPDTVAQASAAASEVLQHTMRSKMNRNLNDVSFMEIEKRIKNLSLKMEEQK